MPAKNKGCWTSWSALPSLPTPRKLPSAGSQMTTPRLLHFPIPSVSTSLPTTTSAYPHKGSPSLVFEPKCSNYWKIFHSLLLKEPTTPDQNDKKQETKKTQKITAQSWHHTTNLPQRLHCTLHTAYSGLSHGSEHWVTEEHCGQRCYWGQKGKGSRYQEYGRHVFLLFFTILGHSFKTPPPNDLPVI